MPIGQGMSYASPDLNSLDPNLLPEGAIRCSLLPTVRPARRIPSVVGNGVAASPDGPGPEALNVLMPGPGPTASFGHPASLAGRRFSVLVSVIRDELDCLGRSAPVPAPCGALRGPPRAIRGETGDRLAAHP